MRYGRFLVGSIFCVLVILSVASCRGTQMELLPGPAEKQADVSSAALDVKPIEATVEAAEDAAAKVVKAAEDAAAEVVKAAEDVAVEVAKVAEDAVEEIAVATEDAAAAVAEAAQATVDTAAKAVDTVAAEAQNVVKDVGKEQFEAKWESLDKRPTPGWFTDAKFGVFIHWGVYSVPGWGPKGQYAEWYWRRTFDEEGGLQKNEWGSFHEKTYGKDFAYEDFAPKFTCEMYDPDQWADIFARSGAKYVVLTSKHHDGFCLWPSEEANKTWAQPWNAVDTGPKRDILGDLTTAVRKRDIKMGFYYSLYEWFNPLWLDKDKRAQYVDEHMLPQMKDLITRYKPDIFWGDGEWEMPSENWRTEEMMAWMFNESPVRHTIAINDRWGKDCRHKHGGYYTTEYGAGMAGAEHPWEECRGMGHSFGYNRNEDAGEYKSTRELLLILIDLTSRGGCLLLDIGPTGDGRIPVIMQERLIQMGDWLKINGEAIYATKSWRKDCQWSEGKQPSQEYKKNRAKYNVLDVVGEGPRDGRAVKEAFFTSKGDALYAILPTWPGKEFVLKDVKPQGDVEVTVLGLKGKLPWRAADEKIYIDLSGVQMRQLPGKHAWVLKIKGL